MVGAEALTIQAAARRQIELDARDGDRRLQQHIAHAGIQRRRVFRSRFAGLRELELEAENQDPDAKRQPLQRPVCRGRGAADKDGRIRERRRGGHDEQDQRDHRQMSGRLTPIQGRTFGSARHEYSHAE